MSNSTATLLTGPLQAATTGTGPHKGGLLLGPQLLLGPLTLLSKGTL